MKRRTRSSRTTTTDSNPTDARSIDERYGLEPVIDPGVSADAPGDTGGVQFRSVECPYCGESFETALDASAGSACYIEDCQICCQPIEFTVEVDHDGALRSFSTLRGD